MQAEPPLRFSQKEGRDVVIPSHARYRLCMVDPSASGDIPSQDPCMTSKRSGEPWVLGVRL